MRDIRPSRAGVLWMFGRVGFNLVRPPGADVQRNSKPNSSELRALRQRQKIVPPNAIGMGLQKFTPGGAGAHTDPGEGVAFLCVEPVLFGLDVLDDVRHGVFPPPTSVGFRATHIGDVLVRAVSVGLVDAGNAVVSHRRHVLSEFVVTTGRPEAAGQSLLPLMRGLVVGRLCQLVALTGLRRRRQRMVLRRDHLLAGLPAARADHVVDPRLGCRLSRLEGFRHGESSFSYMRLNTP